MVASLSIALFLRDEMRVRCGEEMPASHLRGVAYPNILYCLRHLPVSRKPLQQLDCSADQHRPMEGNERALAAKMT